MLRKVNRRGLASTALLLAIAASPAAALPWLGDGPIGRYLVKFLQEMRDPWVWFGFGAQGLFFLRFFYQWLVSEKKGRSTIPIAFWYISLAGALCTFVYAAGRLDPAIMMGQLPACFFYIRNLMLIRGRAERLRRAGLPVTTVREDDLPD